MKDDLVRFVTAFGPTAILGFFIFPLLHFLVKYLASLSKLGRMFLLFIGFSFPVLGSMHWAWKVLQTKDFRFPSLICAAVLIASALAGDWLSKARR